MATESTPLMKRGSYTRRSSVKTWMQEEPEESAKKSFDPQASVVLISRITRFATVMCVVIMIVKWFVYFKSQAMVVKTSALDSMGDLIANCVTCYTSYRMSYVDYRRFPIGQGKFPPIGVLVFSTLMAAMMFGNAIQCVQDLMEVNEKAREDAVSDFWTALFGVHVEGGPGDEHRWADADKGFAALKSAVSSTANLPETLKKALEAADHQHAQEAIQPTIDLVSDVEDPDLNWGNLVFQNSFLACCAGYKLILWLFVLLYALPATSNATVLVALANDKRNDFIATSSVICVTFLAYFQKEQINEYFDPDKIDPLISLILSCVIIYTWVSLLQEQIGFLSSSAVEDEALEAMNTTLRNSLRPGFTGEVRAYYSSVKQTVEVDMNVASPNTPFGDVSNTMAGVKKNMEQLDDVERVIIVPAAQVKDV